MSKIKHYLGLIAAVVFTVLLINLLYDYVQLSYDATIAFKEKYIYLDTVTDQAHAEHYFYFQNMGKKDLEIYFIETSCGCSVVEYPATKLAAQAIDSFKVVYDVANKGYFNTEIMVYSNSKTSPDKLYLRGFVPYADAVTDK
jgi:hypothetical protein